MVTPVVSGSWNAQLYANEALRYLSGQRTFFRTVNLGYQRERSAYQQGDTVTIKRRQTPTIKDETDLTFESLAPGGLQLTVDQYRHTSLNILDWDLAFAGEGILQSHVYPCVDVIADAMTEYGLQQGYRNVGPYYVVGGTPGVSDVTGTQAILLGNKAPTTDEANMFFQVSPTLNASLLNVSAFTQYQGAGPQGATDQITGQLTRRYGFNFLPAHGLSTHTAGTIGGTPLVNGALAKGVTTMAIDGAGASGTVKAGDAFTFSTHSTVYVATADKTASTGAIATLTFSPELQVAVADNVALTFVQSTLNSQIMNLAYHRDAFAVCSVPLPRAAQHVAAVDIGVATDAASGMSLRVQIGYDLATRQNQLVVDSLFGFKVLNPMLACRAAE